MVCFIERLGVIAEGEQCLDVAAIIQVHVTDQFESTKQHGKIPRTFVEIA